MAELMIWYDIFSVNLRWQNRKERPNWFTDNEYRVEKAKSVVVSEGVEYI